MKLLGSVMVFDCNNIDQSLEFYQQAFQFVIIKQRNSERGLQWVYLRSGDVLLMLEQGEGPLPEHENNSRMYLYVDDVAACHHFLRARGFRVSELKTTDYAMQEFDCNDPDGRRLTIGQRITEK